MVIYKLRTDRGGLVAAVTALALLLLTAGGAVAAPGDVHLVSTSDAGVKGNDNSDAPAVTADGRKVAFTSFATNLDAADTDSYSDVFVKDVVTGDLQLASSSATGVKGTTHSSAPSLSADGTKVAFQSGATNIAGGPHWTSSQIYVKDLLTGHVERVSTSDTGVTADFESFAPALSADGTKVAFSSYATNLDGPSNRMQIYVKDLLSGDVRRVSTSDTGEAGDDDSIYPALSADGSKVAFQSFARNLDGEADFVLDVFVKDLTTGDVQIVSTSDAGVKGNGPSFYPALSADGSKVAFHSRASNLDPGDTNGKTDVFVKDLTSGDVQLVSTSDTGASGNGDSSD